MSKIIVLAGDAGVGKTSLISSVKTGECDKRYSATIGCEFHPINMTTTLIDTAGNEAFATPLTQTIYKGADHFVLVYDSTHYRSHRNLQKRYDACKHENPNAPITIVGTKIDLDNHINPTFHIEKNLPHFVISASTGEGISALMKHLEASD